MKRVVNGRFRRPGQSYFDAEFAIRLKVGMHHRSILRCGLTAGRVLLPQTMASALMLIRLFVIEITGQCLREMIPCLVTLPCVRLARGEIEVHTGR